MKKCADLGNGQLDVRNLQESPLLAHTVVGNRLSIDTHVEGILKIHVQDGPPVKKISHVLQAALETRWKGVVENNEGHQKSGHCRENHR